MYDSVFAIQQLCEGGLGDKILWKKKKLNVTVVGKSHKLGFGAGKNKMVTNTEGAQQQP
jgi:hypothetical protein